jgi:hypothetical protein
MVTDVPAAPPANLLAWVTLAALILSWIVTAIGYAFSIKFVTAKNTDDSKRNAQVSEELRKAIRDEGEMHRKESEAFRQWLRAHEEEERRNHSILHTRITELAEVNGNDHQEIHRALGNLEGEVKRLNGRDGG